MKSTEVSCIKQLSTSESIQKFRLTIQEGMAAFERGDQITYKACVNLASLEIGHCCESDLPDLALLLECIWYPLVKQYESDTHYYESFLGHTQKLWEIGRKKSPGPILSGDPNKVAFIAQNSVLLGHTEVMLLVMQDWRRRYPNLKMLFFGLTPCNDVLARRISLLGVKTVCCVEVLTPTKSIEWLRKSLLEEEVGTTVWLSLPTWIAYIYGFRIARRQVLWSLKFHAVHLGNEVIHIGMTKNLSGEELINGSSWHCFQPPLSVNIKNISENNRKILRRDLDSKFIYATLARDEKFNSVNFVASVCDILNRTPDSVFLFTGKKISEILRTEMEKSGLVERCIFVGWIDTDVYSCIADCFLETFPFGCGVTGIQALTHGTNVISMWDSDTLPRFYFKNFNQASIFHENWSVNETIDSYIDSAVACYNKWLLGPVSRRRDIGGLIRLLEADRYIRLHSLVFEN